LECEKENIFAKCGWSPFKALLKSELHTFVNGKLVYNAKVKNIRAGKDCCLIVKY
jgi:hypothetical protein